MPEPIHLDETRLNEYVDGELDDAAQAEVVAHVASCATCAARLAELRVLFGDLAALPDEPLAVDLAPAVLARLPRRARAPAWAPRLALAAQALAAVVAFVLLWPWLAATLQASGAARLVAEAAAILSAMLAGLAPLWRAPVDAAESLLRAASTCALPALPGPVLGWGLGLAGFALAWLLGNGVLLRNLARDQERGE